MLRLLNSPKRNDTDGADALLNSVFPATSPDRGGENASGAPQPSREEATPRFTDEAGAWSWSQLAGDCRVLTSELLGFLTGRWRAFWLISVPVLCVFAWLIAEPPGVFRGVAVAGHDVAGVELSALRQKVFTLAREGANKPVTLVVTTTEHETEVACLPRDIAAGARSELAPTAPYLLESAVARASLVGRELHLLERLQARWQLVRHGFNVPLSVKLDATRLERRLRRVPQRHPHNARLIWKASGVELQPGRSGFSVDAKRATSLIEAALGRGETRVVIPAQRVEPAIISSQLAALSRVRSQAVVPITSRSKNARSNMALSSEALSSVLVRPGQTISLNRIIGERSESRGFLPAPVILSGQRVGQDAGGGICVVATATYMAAREAGLTILERHPHSRPVKYASRQNEAALAWGVKDLRIRNDYKKPVVLMTRVEGRTVQALILTHYQVTS